MIISVKADYTKQNKTKHMCGNFDTSKYTFTSDVNEIFNINKKFEKYKYKARIIITNESDTNLTEWIFTLMPTDEILNEFGIVKKDIGYSSSEEEEYGGSDIEDGGPDTEESDDDYDPDEVESESLEESSETSEEESN
jgi:hypothetical protein